MVTEHSISGAAAMFKALSSPARLTIVHRLVSGPACVHELVSDLDLSQPLVSQHLRVLRSVDLVRGTRRGKEIVYALADEHVGQLVADAMTHSTEDPLRQDNIPDEPNPETEHTS